MFNSASHHIHTMWLLLVFRKMTLRILNEATNSTQRAQQCASLLDKCTAMTASTLKARAVSPVRKTVRSTSGAVAEGHNDNSGISSSNPLTLYQCSITHATAPAPGAD
jgi:hypothetical protein